MKSRSALRSLCGMAAAALVLTAAAMPASANDGEAGPVELAPPAAVENPDGSTTLTFDDGATFTSNQLARAGSFTWSATYDYVVDSRNWTTGGTGDVWIDITNISNCGGKAQRLWLIRGNDIVGTARSISCAGGNYVWRGVPKATYHFQLVDPSTSDGYFNHKASGKVRYR